MANFTYQKSNGQKVTAVDNAYNRKNVANYGWHVTSGAGARPTASRPAAQPVFTGQPVIDQGASLADLFAQQASSQALLDAAAKESSQRDAGVIVSNLFKQYGLESLAGKITEYIKGGYSADAVSLMLQDTTEYKTRFAGNAARIKAGMPVLSPGEYLATERSYQQIMSKYGLPAGFHDQTSDYQKFIEADVSPVELDQRAQKASDFVNRNDAQSLAYFRQYYSNGDMIAFALDPKRAAPLVGKAYEASLIGGAAATQGIGVSQLVSEDLAGRGVNADQASQGFGIVAADTQAAGQLANIYGGGPLTQQDLIDSTFKSDAVATARKNKLASQERANFGGSGGAGSTALSSSNAV